MKIRFLFVFLFGLALIWSCKHEPVFQGEHDPEMIKTYRNNSTPVSKMDSLASVNFITKQKLTEVYELMSLYSVNRNDTVMRNILFPQIKSYFQEKDSLNIQRLLKEMDSLKVNYTEIRGLDLSKKDSLIPDSIRNVNYWVRYYSKDKKLIDSLPKSAKYVLKKEPKKFKHEFIFYFEDLNDLQETKDTISSGVTQ
ncbi:MAG: hypothetical protein H3C39_03250 [Flavobacteriia bacterium]|nr:hypothetical protein [Flavobacteriia bacterium]